MKYDLIAVDLDDSLLGNDLIIGEKNKKALRDFRKKGGIVTIATGRMYNSTLKYAEELDIDVPIITFNGALVKNPINHEVFLESFIPIEEGLKIIKYAEKRNIHVNMYYEGDYYVEKFNDYSDHYSTITGIQGIECGRLSKAINYPVTKLMYIHESGMINKLYYHLKDRFRDIGVFISKPMYLEFINIKASKGIALKALADHYNIDRERIIAIGDSYNDISMIEYAGLGVAMGNSREEVKQAADYITTTNVDEGVAEVINKLVLRN